MCRLKNAPSLYQIKQVVVMKECQDRQNWTESKHMKVQSTVESDPKVHKPSSGIRNYGKYSQGEGVFYPCLFHLWFYWLPTHGWLQVCRERDLFFMGDIYLSQYLDTCRRVMEITMEVSEGRMRPLQLGHSLWFLTPEQGCYLICYKEMWVFSEVFIWVIQDES